MANQLLQPTYEVLKKVCSDFPKSAKYHNKFAWVCARCNRHLDEALAGAEERVAALPGLGAERREGTDAGRAPDAGGLRSRAAASARARWTCRISEFSAPNSLVKRTRSKTDTRERASRSQYSKVR